MALRALFVDFNSYFASVEQQERPELRARPMIVVPVMTDSTCCIAATYEAKHFGIKTGTKVSEARQRCPGLIVVEARPEIYVKYHHRLIEVVDSCLPVTQVRSIDEMSCNLPGSLAGAGDSPSPGARDQDAGCGHGRGMHAQFHWRRAECVPGEDGVRYAEARRPGRARRG